MSIRKVLDAIDAQRAAARPAMAEPHAIESPGLVWMAVHGAICLGLRHPAHVGPSRELVVNFVKALGQELVEWNVLTALELAEVERVEQQESPHG
jgi:hypothetical protein